MALSLSQTWRVRGQNTSARDDVDVDPEDDEPDELPPLPDHLNREGSRLRNKIKETFFGN